MMRKRPTVFLSDSNMADVHVSKKRANRIEVYLQGGNETKNIYPWNIIMTAARPKQIKETNDNWARIVLSANAKKAYNLGQVA